LDFDLARNRESGFPLGAINWRAAYLRFNGDNNEWSGGRLSNYCCRPAKHKDLQLVLSMGDQVDPEQIGPAPGNAIIVKRAPLELLKHTSVCITHAGLNTVLESLAQGVPQVAIPVGADQPGVAARIAEKQTGVVTSLEKLTAEHLSTLLNEVLNNSTYRDSARKMQKAIAKANGLSVAADLIERSLGATKVGRQR
jgi:zeaxanthin glucosyltransferase